jgi:hypothetical protein
VCTSAFAWSPSRGLRTIGALSALRTDSTEADPTPVCGLEAVEERAGPVAGGMGESAGSGDGGGAVVLGGAATTDLGCAVPFYLLDGAGFMGSGDLAPDMGAIAVGMLTCHMP